MKRNIIRVGKVLTTAALATALFASLAFAGVHSTKDAGWKVLAEKDLGDGTKDMFLRRDDRGHTYLYVTSANNKIFVLDVTEVKRMRLITQSSVNESGSRLQGVREGVATTAAIRSNSVSTPEGSNVLPTSLAATIKHVNAYVIDDNSDTAYVAEAGKILAVRFNRPITREAQLWEESYDAR
jgi:hypothetical protein